jgi:hypothetical protein
MLVCQFTVAAAVTTAQPRRFAANLYMAAMAALQVKMVKSQVAAVALAQMARVANAEFNIFRKGRTCEKL